MRLGIPVVGKDLSVWANDMRRWLARSLDNLSYRAAGAQAGQDGTLLWDTAGYPVVTRGGQFKRVAMSDVVFVADKADFPTPVGGVINLADRATYFLTAIADLTGDRIVGGQNTTIIGTSSENAGIKSTGLTGAALISSQWSLPMRHVQLEAETILDLDATGNAGQALDWYGVNLLNTSDIGRIVNYTNFVASSLAFINASGLVLDESVDTIGLSDSIFTASSGTIITIPATATVSRRFRIIYSAFVVTGSAVGINVSASASVPNEGYILDTINFAGGGTYLAGVQPTDNKSLVQNCRGIPNSASISNYYMVGNATATTIAAANTPVKVAGATTSAPITERFTNTVNRATYTGSLSRSFKISFCAALSGTSGDVGALYVAKNGVVVPQSASASTTTPSGKVENLAGIAVINMDQGDYVEIWIENRSASRNMTVEDLTVIVDVAA